jgi:hypothetical protein
LQATPAHTVLVVRSAVNGESGPVVLEHGVNRVRIMDGTPEVGVILDAHEFGTGRVPGVRIGVDHSLGRLDGLSKKEPVPPCRRKARVRPTEGIADRNRIHHDES